VDDAVELLQGFTVIEYDSAKLCPVYLPGIIEYAIPESENELLVRRRPLPVHFMTGPVQVHVGRSEFPEEPGHGALAGPDAAGQSNHFHTFSAIIV